jgi:hypothetical protein
MTRDELKTAVWEASEAKGETNDCTVKALAITTGRDYDDCHKALAKVGRKKGRGTTFHRVQLAAKALGFEMKLRDHGEFRAKTIISAERDRLLRSGNLILGTCNHAAAMVDGKVLDWTEGRRHRIQTVWNITPLPGYTPAVSAEIEFTYYRQDNCQARLF